jgi:phage anti-repressor protein
MNDLIKVEQSQGGKQVVSARELYDFLELDRSQWARWYEKNIIKNEFAIQDTDYQVFDIMSNTQGGRPSKDFAITLDFAKRLAMMARTEKGEQARRYFIECESKLKSLSLPDFTDPAAAAIAWANEYRAKQQLAQQNENLQIALDSHLDWLTILSVAKLNNVSEKVFDWRKLTERSRIMGYEIKKTTCPRFGYRNNYHLNVFRAEYPQYSLTR